jgi:hypothetical protein
MERHSCAYAVMLAAACVLGLGYGVVLQGRRGWQGNTTAVPMLLWLGISMPAFTATNCCTSQCESSSLLSDASSTRLMILSDLDLTQHM